jgi:hypothetical protein
MHPETARNLVDSLSCCASYSVAFRRGHLQKHGDERSDALPKCGELEAA